MLEARLPAWARLHRMDPSKPLHAQVANAKVLIPTTGSVDANVIDSVLDLRLIAQPAAGYNNIDIAAAAQRGVPVTIAPGYNSHSVAEVGSSKLDAVAFPAQHAASSVACMHRVVRACCRTASRCMLSLPHASRHATRAAG